MSGDHLHLLGFDLGGTKLGGIVFDADRGEILARRSVPTVFSEDGLIDAIAALADDLLDGLRTEHGHDPVIASAGIGAPGLVDRAGVLRYGANLPGVLDAPFAARLADRLGIPVAADNDATCAAIAEHRIGSARGVGDAVILTLGTGIGGGFVSGGRLIRGANGFGGEPGHMVVDPSGPLCPCGRRGCWERFASGTALGRMAREAVAAGRGARILQAAGGSVEAVVGEHVSIAAATGDPHALEVLEGFAWWVAAGIANLVALLDPELVVLSGGLVDVGDLLLAPVRRCFTDQVYGGDRRPGVRIELATTGSAAGAIGAALIGLDRRPGDVQA